MCAQRTFDCERRFCTCLRFSGTRFLFVFIAFILLWIVGTHERKAWLRRLLQFLVMTTGGAAIMHPLLLLYGIDF